MVSTRAGSCSEVALPSSSSASTGGRPVAAAAAAHQQQRVYLLDLPHELLDLIFAYVGYKKVAQIRIVSRHMNQVCSLLLNSTFQRLQNHIMNRFQNVKAKMPRRESARRNHPLACECDIVETCHMRLSLLQMTFGKHIERKHCCFFPGGILDEVFNVLHHIRVTQVLGRPYKVTDELFDLSTMAMEYFKEHIEPGLPVPDLVYFSKSFLDFTSPSKQNYLDAPSTSSDNSFSSGQPSPPHMVLRKGIRKIRQGMKKYNNQLTVLRNELRSCKRKATEQSKLIAEQQKLIAEQQKQTIEYATRLDDNEKKNEEMSRKFATLLQEQLNKCKTEFQYWAGSSPPAVVSHHTVSPETTDNLLGAVAVAAATDDDPMAEQFPTTRCFVPKRKLIDAETACSSNGAEEAVGSLGSPPSTKKARRTVVGKGVSTSSKAT